MVDNGVELPILETHVAQIVSLYDLEEITNCIGDGGEVVDSASDKLRGIRTQIRTAESRIREKLENMTRSSNAQRCCLTRL